MLLALLTTDATTLARRRLLTIDSFGSGHGRLAYQLRGHVAGGLLSLGGPASSKSRDSVYARRFRPFAPQPSSLRVEDRPTQLRCWYASPSESCQDLPLCRPDLVSSDDSLAKFDLPRQIPNIQPFWSLH